MKLSDLGNIAWKKIFPATILSFIEMQLKKKCKLPECSSGGKINQSIRQKLSNLLCSGEDPPIPQASSRR